MKEDRGLTRTFPQNKASVKAAKLEEHGTLQVPGVPGGGLLGEGPES